MIKSVLEMAGKKVGLIGTIGAMIGDEHIPSKNTTPESYELHRMFAAMVEAGCEYVVMEVSSQGLKLDRTAGILFDYGVFTNLSRITSDRRNMSRSRSICTARVFCSGSAVSASSMRMILTGRRF